MNTKIFGKFGKKFAVGGGITLLSVAMFAGLANADTPLITFATPTNGSYLRGESLIDWSFNDVVYSDTANLTYSNDFNAWQSNAIGGTISTTTTSYNWNTIGISDGLYKVKIEDNFANATTSDEFYLDNTAPETTIDPSSSTGWWNVGIGAPTITLTCTDPTVGEVASGCSSINYAWYNATSSVMIGTATTTVLNTSSDNSFSTGVTAPQGDNVLVYFSEDNAVDNTGAHNVENAQSMEFKVDTNAPIAPVITSIAGDDYINFYEATSTVVMGTAEANSKILMNLSDGISYADATTTVDGSGNFTATLDTTTAVSFALTDGTITATVTAVDEAENVSPSATKDAIKDTVAEISSITSNATTPDLLKIGDTIEFTMTPTTTEDGAAVTGSYNGQTLSWSTGDSGVTYTATYTVVEGDPDQTSAFQISGVTYTDVAGNTSPAFDGTDVAVTIDATAPDAPAVTGIEDDTGSSNSDGITNDNTLKFNGTSALDVVSVELFIASGSKGSVIPVAGAWSLDNTAETLVDGTNYQVTAKATDLAGNVSVASDVFVLGVDTTAPDAPVIESVATDNIINSTEENSTVIEGTAEENTSVEVTIDDGTTTETATGVATGGTFSIAVDTTSLNEGGLTVTANTTNIAGNISPDTADYGATKDTVAPTVVSITTKDADMNGQIDTATIVFDEPILDSTLSGSDFTFNIATGDGKNTGSTTDDEIIDVTLGGEIMGTETKYVTYTPGLVTDIAGNPLVGFSEYSTDGAGPVPMAARTMSTTTIKVMFSEDLDETSSDVGDFYVAGNTVTATSEAFGNVILTLDTPMGTGDTPDVTVFGDGTFGLKDNTTPGNWSPQDYILTSTTDGVAPILSNVKISSANMSPESTFFWTKTGETATLTFTSSENIVTPTVIIDGQPATTISEVSTNNWEATYVFTGSEAEGVIPFTIDFEDTATPTANQGTQITTTGDSSEVLYDKTAPVVEAGTDKEVNTDTLQTATVSDALYQNGSAVITWEWTKVSGPGTLSFTPNAGGDPNDETNTANTTISADMDGTYVAKLTGTDNAGNVNSDTMEFIWDTENPVEIASTPSNGANDVPTTIGDIKVMFNEPITSLDVSKVMLTDVSTGNPVVSGTITISGNTINIPHSAFTDGTQYRINVLPGAVKDIAGNSLTVNFIHLFTTSATPDTTAPAVPVISNSDATVDANYYTITGTSADNDGEQRIVNLYNNGSTTPSGTAVLAPGATNWTINAKLTQESDNVFTATATDGAGNESGASNSVTITEADPIAVVPTLTLVGDTILSSYTATEATTRFASGLQFDITNTESFTVNGLSVATSSTITAKTMAEATTLGSHIYNVVVTSPTGDTANILLNYEVTADVDDIAIDDIVAVSSSATADDTYANGWHYIYKITVNTSETNLSVKFANWLQTGGSGTVPANGNMRLLFNTATGNGLGGSVGAIPETDIINGFGTVDSYEIGNDYSDQTLGGTAQDIDISGLDASTRAGRQVQFDVYTKLPLITPAGFYETEYGIKTL